MSENVFDVVRDKPGDAATMLYQSVKDLFTDNGPQWAAAIGFYALLSVFPLLLAAASIAAFFVDPKWAVDQATGLAGTFLPAGQGKIAQIVEGAIDARRNASIISILFLLWTGSRVFGTLTQALNIAFDVDESYGFLKRTAIQFLMVLTLGILFVVALASGPVITFVWNILGGLGDQFDGIRQVLLWAVPALLMWLALALTYHFVPRRRIHWGPAIWSALLVTLVLMIARPLFVTYVQKFGNYNVIYGSLAIVIILLLWTWIGALIILLGGEVASHIETMLLQGRSAEEVERRHKQRAPTRKPVHQ